jgi:hypothetical protein
MASSMRSVLVVLTVVLSCIGSSAAQIIILQKVGDKTIQCMHTGLSSDLNDCGGHSDWYTYVFVGSISAITSTKDDEKELQILPEEIFHGEPANPLTVRTSQGACLPELRVGDHWLFYLRSGNPIVLDFYGNISRPTADAQQQLETLRRLETIGDNGIVRGRVMRGPSFSQSDAVPDAHVVARRASDDAEFVATTGADGRYEFQPLPPGKYKLTVDPVKSFHPDDSNLDVSSRTCWDLTLSRSPHAHLGGHVRRSNGTPAPQVAVVIAKEDGSWFTTEKSDARGYFHTESLPSGKYVVGINLPGAPAWKYAGCGGACEVPPASLYYPGMRNRSDALVINLASDEKRDDIDFTAPTQ